MSAGVLPHQVFLRWLEKIISRTSGGKARKPLSQRGVKEAIVLVGFVLLVGGWKKIREIGTVAAFICDFEESHLLLQIHCHGVGRNWKEL